MLTQVEQMLMSLFKRNGTWWVDISSPNGKRIRKSAKTKVKKEAQEFHDKLKIDEWRRHQLGEKPQIRRTWEEAVVRYLTIKEDIKWLKDTKQNIRDLHTWLHGKYLDEIDKELISRITDERKAMPPRSNSGKGKTVSNATVNRMLSVLSAILKMACNEWEWLKNAPKVTKLKEIKKEPRWLSSEEVQRLHSELPEHLQAMFLFSIYTGVRMSNVTGLRWEQVNFKERTIFYNGSDMKNATAQYVPLSQEAIDLLMSQIGSNDEYVFTYRGKPVTDCNTRAFKRALARAEVDDIRWHDLRHTFASWHIQNGTPLLVLKELGGWKSLEMVQRYAHLDIGHLAQYTQNTSIR